MPTIPIRVRSRAKSSYETYGNEYSVFKIQNVLYLILFVAEGVPWGP
jgi:hypothetical protein